jgi:hypothetical protein
MENNDDEDALKCLNLERNIDAELYGQPVPTELNMSEFLGNDCDGVGRQSIVID